MPTPGEYARARLDRIRKLAYRPAVRIEPANDDVRRVLKHPKGRRFPDEGAALWPDDTFTRRRLRDGSVRRAGNLLE